MGIKTSVLRMKYKNTVNYLLEFGYYRYNTGSGDNGFFKEKIEYDSLEEAQGVWDKIESLLRKEETSDFLDKLLGEDGFIEELIAIYEVKTNKTYDEYGLLKLEKSETRIKQVED